MANFDDIKLFGETSLSDIFKQIHKNNKKIDGQIEGLVTALKPLINSAGEAVMVMPVVKDLIDVNVKNNDQLVKIAGIAQRASSPTKASDAFYDPSEMQALLDEHRLTQEESSKLIEQGETVKKQIEG
jgi:hypothetical protein